MDTPHTRPLTVGMIAGEASGDALGAHLIDALRAAVPDCRILGIGGSKMIQSGCESLFLQEKLAVRGFVEVARKLPEILAVRRGIVRALLQEKPDVFIGIDAPDFNFGVEKRLKKQGIPTIHYVSPSVWAWRGGRVKKIVRIADRVLCLFPMEPELYRAAGGRADFVGHPLAQTLPEMPDRSAARALLGLAENRPVFTVMPGSRHSEIDYLGEIFLQTAVLLAARYPQAHFLLPAATDSLFARLQTMLAEKYAALPLTLLRGQSHGAIVAADAVLAASGTTTLEVALCKRPMVIAYKISPLTFRIVKSLFKLPYVGLPNILLEHFAVPELLQEDAAPENLAAALGDWYENPAKTAALQEKFTRLHHMLKQDTAALAAQAVLAEVRGRAR